MVDGAPPPQKKRTCEHADQLIKMNMLFVSVTDTRLKLHQTLHEWIRHQEMGDCVRVHFSRRKQSLSMIFETNQLDIAMSDLVNDQVNSVAQPSSSSFIIQRTWRYI